MFGVGSIVKYIGDEKAKALSRKYSIPWSPYEFIQVYDIGIVVCMHEDIEEDETQLYNCRFITGCSRFTSTILSKIVFKCN